MILLLGADTYIGQAFASYLAARGDKFVPLSPAVFDYTRFELLFDYVRKMRPSFVINAGNLYSGELPRTDIFRANTVLPETAARVCVVTNTPWGHVSSGSIFSGAKAFVAGKPRIIQNWNHGAPYKPTPPTNFFGFTELDEPNRSFQSPPCDFHAGTIALAEKALREYARGYIWRFRTPFDDRDDSSNWLSQLQCAASTRDAIHSASHLTESVGACLELWERQAPFGIYNIVNPGTVTTSEVLQMIQRNLRSAPRLERLLDRFSAPDPHRPGPDCILDGSKLLRAGVKLRNLPDALEDALNGWQSANQIRLELNQVTESPEVLHWPGLPTATPFVGAR